MRAGRQARKMTLASLAEASGLTKGLLSQVEHGRSRPSLKSLDRLANSLGLPVQSLLYDEEKPGTHPAEPAKPHLFRSRKPGAAGGSLTLLVSGANGAIAIAQLPPLWALIWAGECGASTAYQAFCAVLDGEVRFEQAHAQLVLLQGDGLGWDAGAPYVFENRSLVGASLLVSMASAVDLSRVMRVVAPTEQVVQLGATTARASAPVSGEGPLRLVAMRAERRSRAGGQR